MTNRMSLKLVFLYDKLMTKKEQELVRLPIKFLSYGYIRAKMYWVNDGKRRRYFCVAPEPKPHVAHRNTHVYGGLFVINDFEEYQQAFYSYYNSSIPYTGNIMQEDLYVPSTFDATPIRFRTMEEFELCKYERLGSASALVFLGNKENEKIKHSLARKYYRHTTGIDVPNFLQMIKEQ